MKDVMLVSLDYPAKNSAISQYVERLHNGTSYPRIILSSNSANHAFINLVTSSFRAYISNRFGGRKFMVSIDGKYLFPDLMVVFHPYQVKENRVEEALNNLAMRNAGSFIAISDFVAGQVRSKFDKPLKVIKCGVDVHDVIPRVSRKDEIVVSHIGGIAPGASRRTPMLQVPRILRETFPGKNIRFIHVRGKQNENEQALQDNCQKYKIKYDLRPPQANENVYGIYAESDIYIYLSLEEGYSITPAEALSMETPVVINDLPIHLEVYDGKPGVNFCRLNSEQTIKEALTKAYQMGPSATYREKAIERTWQDMIDEFSDYISSLP